MSTLPKARIGLSALLLLCALGTTGCTASDASEAGGSDGHDRPPEPSPTVPVGTSLTFSLDQTVSTDTHRAGDTFTSTLTAPGMGLEGGAVLEAGSAGLWSVVESTDDDGDGQSVLVVRLEQVQMAGRRYPVNATVVESRLQTDEADSKSETAAKIGIGAAAGALAGRLLGDDAKDALKGAGVGAAMGTVVALATRKGSAKLPAGSRMVVRLDKPLVLK